MRNLKKELFFYFNSKEWESHIYASEVFHLLIENKAPEIKFSLYDKYANLLSGTTRCDKQIIYFNFDKPKSLWLKDTHVENDKAVALLSSLFNFMCMEK